MNAKAEIKKLRTARNKAWKAGDLDTFSALENKIWALVNATPDNDPR